MRNAVNIPPGILFIFLLPALPTLLGVLNMELLEKEL